MQIRRALLLFAVVLGLAAIAASMLRPRDEGGESPRSPPAAKGEPTVSPGPAGKVPVTLVFDAERAQTRRLEVGRAATVEVAVDEPGLVEIPLLGRTAPAGPVTPARFDILASEVRRYGIEFTPAAGDESRPAGTLAVTPANR